ncbi:MAG: hypothetical protein MR260_05580 [Spirochaetia bacterium]|nr:hypothetical protein [Spirochaetia bacterium]
MTNGIELMKKEIGVAILPESAWNCVNQQEIIKKELAQTKITDVSIIWKKGIELPNIAKKFLEFVQSRQN